MRDPYARSMDFELGNARDTIREAERRKARRNAGKPLHETPAELEQRTRSDDNRLEKEIQRDCVRIYRANGCVVYETSQKRAAKVTPGLPDLIVFHARAKAMWYHEVKTATGELRPDQRDFQEQCQLTGTPHYVGGIEAAERALTAHTQLPLSL